MSKPTGTNMNISKELSNQKKKNVQALLKKWLPVKFAQFAADDRYVLKSL